MIRGVQVEFLKMRRSSVVMAATILMAVLAPMMGAAFVWVAETGGAGVIGAKAEAFVVGEGWEAYFGIVNQVAATAMFLGIGVVVAWTFGREYVDRTFPSLFALPISRGKIASAKILVLVGWIAVLALVVAAMTVAIGLLIGVGEEAGVTIIVEGALQQLAVVGLTGLLALTTAPVASIGRGYLPAIGAIIVVIAVSQILVLLGSGAWLPFVVPGLLAVNGAGGVPVPNGLQILLVPALSAIGVWVTIWWWGRSEVA